MWRPSVQRRLYFFRIQPRVTPYASARLKNCSTAAGVEGVAGVVAAGEPAGAVAGGVYVDAAGGAGAGT